jgi:phosphatidate cytidylyltransferase
VSRDKATPALQADRGLRNLLTRVLAALVLIPITIAVAYVGGWFWLGLVVLAAIGLYVEWLMIVGGAGDKGVAALGVIALVSAGASLALGRIEVSFAVVAFAVVVVALWSSQRRG